MIHPVRIDENHKYWVPAPEPPRELLVPGFTHIAESLGFIQENPFYTDSGREEGIALHKWLRHIAQGKPILTKPDERIAGRVEAILKFIAETGFKFAGGEEPRYDPVNRFACTPDLWGYIGSWTWDLDAKRGEELPHHRLQTAAQSIALAANGFRAQKRGCLYLKDGSYRLKEHIDSRDIPAWKQIVSTYYLKGAYQ